MDTKGVMQQIREQLIEGKSSQEVIALGYAPGSVYKIQRQLRRSDGEKGGRVPQGRGEVPSPTADAEALAKAERLAAENAQLRQQIRMLEEQLAEVSCLRLQLEHAQGWIEELEAQASQVQPLREQVNALQSQQAKRERLVLALVETIRASQEHPPQTLFGKMAQEMKIESLLARILG
jgi:hypothetical protein